MTRNKQITVNGITDEDRDIWEKWIRGEINLPVPADRRLRKEPDRPRTKLDLHGLTLQQAWNATRIFLEEHYLAGSREVIIVCGKGGQISQELDAWCSNTGLVSICRPMMDSRGEHGAYRITMRRRRK